jgi:predicted transcriptional regulator
MSVPCEVVVKCVLPVVRAMVARKLMLTHGFRQVEAARVLGVSQPAISLYSRNIRGKAIDLANDRDIPVLIASMARSLADGSASRRDVVLMYCEICKAIRAKGLMCELHKSCDPSVEVEKCRLCLDTGPVYCP